MSTSQLTTAKFGEVVLSEFDLYLLVKTEIPDAWERGLGSLRYDRLREVEFAR